MVFLCLAGLKLTMHELDGSAGSSAVVAVVGLIENNTFLFAT